MHDMRMLASAVIIRGERVDFGRLVRREVRGATRIRVAPPFFGACVKTTDETSGTQCLVTDCSMQLP
jgi:hypothetical protein